MKKRLALAISVSLAAGAVQAQSMDDVSVNGFGTVGGVYSDSEHGRTHGLKGNIDDNFSMEEDSRAGVQLKYDASENVDFALQGLVDAVDSSYRGNVSWAYGSYQATDNTTVRAGRLRAPLYLKSDTKDVGYTYPWLRVPSEVYTQVPMDSFEGIDVLHEIDVGGQRLNLQAFGGTVSDTEVSYYNETADIGVDEVYGASVELPVEYGFFRAAHGRSVGVDIEADDGSYNFTDIDGEFTSIGASLRPGNNVILAEWALREGPSQSGVDRQESWYTTYGYQVTPSILPHLTYSTMDDKSVDGEQYTVAAGVRYDVAFGVSLKAEVSHTETDDYNGEFTNGVAERGFLAQQPDSFFDLPGAPNQDTKATTFGLGVDFIY